MSNFKPALTEDEAREIIKAADIEYAIDAAKMFANVLEADIDEAGDVWIANPCAGHWLRGDKLCSFAEGLASGL